MGLEGQLLPYCQSHYPMQHLRDESIRAVSMLACRTGINAILSFWFHCPLRLVDVEERVYANNGHAPGWRWGRIFYTLLQQNWSFYLTLPSFWGGHFLFSHMTVTYRYTWMFIMSFRGLNETNIKLEKVWFRAFKVFVVLTNVGYYGVKHRNSFTISWKTKYLKPTEVRGRYICHCFEGLCDSY